MPTAVKRWRDERLGLEVLAAEGVAEERPAHHHPHWQLGLLSRGSLNFVWADVRLTVTAGDVVVVPSGVTHAVLGGHGEYLQVDLAEDWDGPRDGFPAPWVTRDHALRASLLVLADPEANDPDGNERGAALESLKGALLRLRWASQRGESTTDPLVERVTTYLHAHLNRVLTVAELTEVAACSRATLWRRFRAEHHTTPLAFHRCLRVQAALSLVDSGMAISDAAARTGFSDQAHFSRLANVLLAVSPARWRRRPRR